MDELFSRLNGDQRKLVTGLLNTLEKLFPGGGFVAPFLGQLRVSAWLAVMAIMVGLALHGAALYILRETKQDDD